MQVAPTLAPTLFEVVVDQDAEPLDLDRFLAALDRLVERRLAARNQTTPAGTPAAERSNITTGEKGRSI